MGQCNYSSQCVFLVNIYGNVLDITLNVCAFRFFNRKLFVYRLKDRDSFGQIGILFVGAGGLLSALAYYEQFVEGCRKAGLPVETGIFRAHMLVELVNNGPVTILLDSTKLL